MADGTVSVTPKKITNFQKISVQCFRIVPKNSFTVAVITKTKEVPANKSSQRDVEK